MKGHNEELLLFSQRAEKHVAQLVNAAYAITGNRDMALDTARAALKRAYMTRHEWMRVMPFSDALLRALFKTAFSDIRSNRRKGEEMTTWDRTLPGMNADTVRVLLMEYGCGMRIRRIAYAMGMPEKRVRSLSARLRRLADEEELEARAAALLVGEMLTGDTRNGILFDFQSEIKAQRGLCFRLRGVIGWLFRFAALLLFAAFVWLVCILITK